MSADFNTAKVKLVTIIAGSELQERLEADLKEIGIKGFSLMRVDGYGVHGPRRHGLLGSGNVRFETLVQPDMGAKLMEHLTLRYKGWGLVAFMQEVETVPHEGVG
jgi:nitrogen regulatory protein PII